MNNCLGKKELCPETESNMSRNGFKNRAQRI